MGIRDFVQGATSSGTIRMIDALAHRGQHRHRHRFCAEPYFSADGGDGGKDDLDKHTDQAKFDAIKFTGKDAEFVPCLSLKRNALAYAGWR